MDLFKAISKRYSYRGDFTSDPIPREDLRKIVQAGIQAPSAKNEQVAHFVIIDDIELIKKIADFIDKPYAATARAMIVIATENRAVFQDFSFALEDASACAENMLLAIAALGYATVWIDGALRVGDVAARIESLLDIPDGCSARILLPVGVPVERGQQKEKQTFEQRAWFNRYGG